MCMPGEKFYFTSQIFVTVHDDVDAPKLDLTEPSIKVSYDQSPILIDVHPEGTSDESDIFEKSAFSH